MAELNQRPPGKVFVVIPALNEEKAIRAVVSSALSHCPDVIVIDDGSSDGTSEAIKDLAVHRIRHPTPMGKALALKDGFRLALEKGCSGVITMDGDGQHSADDIPRLLAAAAHYTRHIIIGARLLRRSAAPGARRFGNGTADWFISWACGQNIVDTQSGQRYYPRVVLELAQSMSHSGFVFESEILIEAAWRLGVRTVSVPIETRYEPDARASHFRPVRDISGITRMVAGRLARRGFMPGNFLSARREPAIVIDPTAH